MKYNSFGQLLEQTRVERKISKRQLCHGLCTVPALTRYEQNERLPDCFLADALLERLGLDPGFCEFITSESEFLCRQNRLRIDDLLHQGEVTSVVTLLNQYVSVADPGNGLQQQYLLLIKATICGNQGDYEKADSLLLEALQCTKCYQPLEQSTFRGLLTGQEIKILYLLAQYRYKEEKKEETYKIFSFLEQYFNDTKWDYEKRKEYEPYILYHLALKEQVHNNFGKAIDYLNRAEQILLTNYKIELLYEVLELKKQLTSETSKDHLMLALKLLSFSKEGRISKEGMALWESIENPNL